MVKIDASRVALGVCRCMCNVRHCDDGDRTLRRNSNKSPPLGYETLTLLVVPISVCYKLTSRLCALAQTGGHVLPTQVCAMDDKDDTHVEWTMHS